MAGLTFEERMRELEYFHGLRLLPHTWCVIRVDGRGFSKFTEEHYEKPFDEKLHQHMKETTRILFEELQADYGYTESDEISLLFRPQWDLLSRSLEKIVSVSAGLASASFTKASGLLGHFDSRVWLSAKKEEVIDYFRWRQSDGARCCLNQWCYWTLRKEGHNPLTNETVLVKRRRIIENSLLPMKEEYSEFLQELVATFP